MLRNLWSVWSPEEERTAFLSFNGCAAPSMIERSHKVTTGTSFPCPVFLLCGRIIGKIEEGRKINRCCQGVRYRSQRCFTAVEDVKTTGMCSRRHGGGRVRSTTPAEDRYIVPSAKSETGAPQLSRWQISLLLPQESRSAETIARRLRRRTIAGSAVIYYPDSTAQFVFTGRVITID
ncbi:hypothetical protein TNCV_3907611 [Trichonephila clavipes]|nr:hypothetical protein TNCV_3907611 [Trichonephila clavipes]